MAERIKQSFPEMHGGVATSVPFMTGEYFTNHYVSDAEDSKARPHRDAENQLDNSRQALGLVNKWRSEGMTFDEIEADRRKAAILKKAANHANDLILVIETDQGLLERNRDHQDQYEALKELKRLQAGLNS